MSEQLSELVHSLYMLPAIFRPVSDKDYDNI